MKFYSSRICSVALSIAAATLTACGVTPPRNAAEFRAMAKESSFVSNETFEVKRPYKQVVDTFKQRAPACLDRTVQSGWQNGNNAAKSVRFTEVRTWKAKVATTDRHMELTLQSLITGGNTFELAPPDKDGHYYMVVDAYPVNPGTTRIDIVSATHRVPESVGLAAKNWATGENVGCPDMTQ